MGTLKQNCKGPYGVKLETPANYLHKLASHVSELPWEQVLQFYLSFKITTVSAGILTERLWARTTEMSHSQILDP